MFNLSIIFMALIPFLVAFFSFLSWLLVAMLKTSVRGQVKRNAVTTTVVFSFLIYPTIVNYTFEMFNCIDIEGVTYLKRDFTLECWSGAHVRNILIIGLPVIIVWVFGFPAFIFRILYKNKARLNEKNMLIKYGLFYVGLNDRGYYWEVLVVNIRKILFVGVVVSLTRSSSQLQGMLCFSVLYSTHFMLKQIKPYNKAYLNFTDVFSSFAAIVTLLNGIFFMNDENANKNDSESLVIFIAVVLFNGAFLCYWGVRIVMALVVKG